MFHCTPPTAEPGTVGGAGYGRRPSRAKPLVSSCLGLLLTASPAPCPQELLLAPTLLEQLTCTPGSRELGQILRVPQGQQIALQGYRDAVCRGQAAARAQRFAGLAAELRNQLDVAKITRQVRPCLPAGPQSCCLGWRRCQAPWHHRGLLGPRLCLVCLGLDVLQLPPGPRLVPPALSTALAPVCAPSPASAPSPHPGLLPSSQPVSCVPCQCPPHATPDLSHAPAGQPPDPVPFPGSAFPHLPRFPSAGPGCCQRLRPPAAAATPTAVAGAPGGPAGRPKGSPGRGCSFGPGPAAASGRLRRPGSWAPRQRPWRGGQWHRGWRGHRLQHHGRRGCPIRCSPSLLGRAAGPVLCLRAALGRPAAHPVRQQPVGGWQGKGGEGDRWGGA